LAERRYRRVDPDHCLVADALEADWNAKLRALADAQRSYEEQSKDEPGALNDEQRREILALATDFPRLWNDPATPAREKKRMARLLIEDVTLSKDTEITAHVRFRSGATRTLSLQLPLSAADLRRTDAEVVRRVDELLDHHAEHQIATLLNAEGLRTGTGLSFNLTRVARIRSAHGLTSRYDRLRERGLLTVHEMAEALDVEPYTVKIWRAAGLLAAFPYSAKNQCLYEPPGDARPRKHAWKGLTASRRAKNATRSCPRGTV